MRSELEHALVGPPAAVAYPKEALTGLLVSALVSILVASVLALPLALWSAPQWPLWLNVVVALIIGGFVGGTIGVVAGAAGAARGPAEPLAAEVGTTVRVASARPEVLRILEVFDPIRVDIVLPDGTPAGDAPFEAPDHALKVEAERLLHQRDTDWDDRQAQQEARDQGRIAHE